MTSLNGNNAIQSSSWLTNLGTTATTQSAIAIGNGAEATSPYSIAIGYEALNFNRDGGRDYYTAIGYQARAVQGGTALGKNANAAGANATSIGQNAQTFGNGAFAMGNNTLAASTNGVAIGGNAQDLSNNSSVAIGDSATANGDYEVVIGTSASASASYAVAVGPTAQATHQSAVSLGNGVNSVFTSTTHTAGLYVGDNFSCQVATLANIPSFDINFNTASSYQITLNQDAVINFQNFRDGGRYLLYINNTGTYNITGVTTTAGAVFFDDNGQKNITHNGKDLWIITPFGNTQLVQQVQNFV